MKARFTLESKMYIFVAAVVLFAAFGVALFSYIISSNQMESFDKRITQDSAKNYASLTDADYLKRLKEAVLSEEYQQLRAQAEENDDEAAVISYLKDKGLWEQYETERNKLRAYAENISDIKYLYIVVWGVDDSIYNMYLLDADDVPVYETGLYEEREQEFINVSAYDEVEPDISNGSWGWLCSAYSPVYDSEGQLICTVGCDLSMDDAMVNRRAYFLSLIITTVILTLIILAGAVKFVHKTVVSPLTKLTDGMKRFDPQDGQGYEEAGVIKVDVKSNDEIRDIYEETRSMQVRIIDHINSIIRITREKEMAEDVVRSKEQEIGAMSRKAYRDSLTGVGNKAGYTEKMAELNEAITRGDPEFAIVMMDINKLKTVNDTYGHAAGDMYIKGCCMVFCEVFKHSPVYRIGGDEFVAVLTGGDYKDRFEKLEEMESKFAKTENDTDLDHWLRFSASMGMAEYTAGDKTSEEIFRRADQLMYKHKQEHRNKAR